MSFDRKTSSEALPTLSTMTTTVTIPEKTALSNVSTICTTPVDRSPRTSNVSTPEAGKSSKHINPYQNQNPFESDMEVGMVPTSSTDRIACGQKGISLCRKSDSRVWPGKEHWKQKAKAAKMKRSWCNCLAGLSHRNKIIAKVLIIVLIVGIAVGVGFGVSKPLNAPIWHDHSN